MFQTRFVVDLPLWHYLNRSARAGDTPSPPRLAAPRHNHTCAETGLYKCRACLSASFPLRGFVSSLAARSPHKNDSLVVGTTGSSPASPAFVLSPIFQWSASTVPVTLGGSGVACSYLPVTSPCGFQCRGSSPTLHTGDHRRVRVLGCLIPRRPPNYQGSIVSKTGAVV